MNFHQTTKQLTLKFPDGQFARVSQGYICNLRQLNETGEEH